MKTYSPPALSQDIIRLMFAVLLVASVGLTRPAQANVDPRPQKGGIKIELTGKGIYRVTGADLSSAGVDISTVDPDTIRLFHRDTEIRIIVSSAQAGRLQATDIIRFYAPGVDNSFTGVDVYWLYWGTGVSGRRMLAEDGAAAGNTSPISTAQETLVIEENHTLWTETPGAPENDYWFWDKLTAPQTKTISFDVPSLAVSGNAILSVYFQGRSQGTGSSGYHTVIALNGQTIGDETWSGTTAHAQTMTVPLSALKNTANQMVISYGDSGSAGGIIYLNRMEVNYQKNLTADNNALIFTLHQPEPEPVAVSNFTGSDVIIFDITDPANAGLLSGVAVQAESAAFRAVFQHSGGDKTYAAAAADGIKTPDRLTFRQPPDLKDTANGADYILISDQAFMPALEKLCELRRLQGLRVKTVSVEDIYDAFSFGFFDPSAVRDFLEYAFVNWQKPAPRYVLMAGDSNLDYRDYFGTGKKNIVPVHLSYTQELGLTPSDNWFVSFDDAGVLPSMDIGRIPGAKPEDVTPIVNKLIRYETSKSEFPGRALLVADDDTAFEDLNNLLATYLPPEIAAVKIYARLYASLTAVTSDILTSVDSGALITSFVGHGDVIRWGAEPTGGGNFIISATNLAGLTNKNLLTLVLALDCLNGYFSQSYDYSLAEEWVKAPDKGAVACIAPSGLSHSQEHELFGAAVFANIFQKKENRIGDICTRSKLDAYYGGASDKVLISLNLTGDPATRLAIYRTPADLVTAYWISADAGPGGSIAPSGETPAFDGDTETFSVTPADGYAVSDVSVDGVSQGAVSAYTLNGIHTNHAISVTFKAKSGGGGGGGGGCFINTLQ